MGKKANKYIWYRKENKKEVDGTQNRIYMCVCIVSQRPNTIIDTKIATEKNQRYKYIRSIDKHKNEMNLAGGGTHYLTRSSYTSG